MLSFSAMSLNGDPLILGLLYIPMLFGVRRLVVLVLRRQMRQVSGAVPTNADAEADAVSTAPARTKLQFQRFDESAPSPEARAASDAVVAQSKRLFRIAFALEVVAGFAYAFLLADPLFKAVGQNSNSQFWATVFLCALPTLPIARYILYRRQYLGYRGWLSEYLRGAAWMIKEPLAPRWQPLMRYLLPLLAVYFVVTGRATKLGALELAALVVVHVIVMLWFERALRRVPGPSLLLLRVFGVKKSSALTLDGLLDRWCHIGTYLTVMDPELLRQRTPVVTFGNYLLSLPVLILLFTADSDAWWWCVLIVLAVLSLVGWRSYRLVSRQRIGSPAQMLQMLDSIRSRPRQSDLSFRTMETSCFDNTWRPTVAEAASRADVVLMDLRGYTPERQGCRTEVKFLFAHVPMQRVLFLVGPDDVDHVKQLLGESWGSVGKASPNAALQAPTAQLLVFGDSEASLVKRAMGALTAEPGADIQRLMNDLIGIAELPKISPALAGAALASRA